MQISLALVATFLLVQLAISAVPDSWIQGERANPKDIVKLTIAVRYRPEGIKLLDEILTDVSNPKSTNYGNYLSKEQVEQIVGPDSESVQIVENWLKSTRAISIERASAGSYLIARYHVADAESALSIELFNFSNEKGHKIIRSPVSYTIDEEVAPHVDLITGATDFPVIERLSDARRVPKSMAAQANHTAPEPNLMFTATSQLFAIFMPRCSNGHVPEAKFPLCASNNSNPITSFVFTLKSHTDLVVETRTVLAQPPYLQCAGEPLSCTALIEPVSTFHVYNVSVATVFQSGPASPSAPYGFKVQVTSEVTPRALRKHYKIPESASIVSHPLNSQAVAEFGGQYYSPDDLHVFYKLMGMPPPKVTVVGPNNGSMPGDESTLDIQYLLGMSPATPTTFWSVEIGGFMLEWALQVLNSTNPPLVHSVSYGSTERALKLYYPAGYMERCDKEFLQMGARGLSVMIAAGDAGAGNFADSSPRCNPLHPNYPTSSPYVTSVGATVLSTLVSDACYDSVVFGLSTVTCTAIGEMSVSGDLGTFWTSGGGFSDRTPRQPWQQKAVSDYLNNQPAGNLPPSNEWNINGRGYPDVSAVGHNLLIFLEGAWMTVDGTSASTPIFSGVVTLLNNLRLYSNKPVLGYLNPLLYQLYSENPSTFNDVTFGNNRCGCYKPPVYTQLCKCPYGFNATVAWDPASGLGTPNYPNLAEAVLNSN